MGGTRAATEIRWVTMPMAPLSSRTWRVASYAPAAMYVWEAVAPDASIVPSDSKSHSKDTMEPSSSWEEDPSKATDRPSFGARGDQVKAAIGSLFGGAVIVCVRLPSAPLSSRTVKVTK